MLTKLLYRPNKFVLNCSLRFPMTQRRRVRGVQALRTALILTRKSWPSDVADWLAGVRNGSHRSLMPFRSGPDEPQDCWAYERQRMRRRWLGGRVLQDSVPAGLLGNPGQGGVHRPRLIGRLWLGDATCLTANGGRSALARASLCSSASGGLECSAGGGQGSQAARRQKRVES